MDEDELQIYVPINNDLDRKIADAFDTFDHSGTKTIDAREVGTVVRSLGCCPTEAEIQELVMRMEEPTNPGNVHLGKFLPLVTSCINEHKFQPSPPEQLLEAFQTLDPLGKGFLTKEYMSTIMTQDGEPFTQDELDEMLEIAVDPHTQTIPYEYYINQLMYEPKVEEDVYKMADEIVASRPRTRSRRFSSLFIQGSDPYLRRTSSRY